MDAQEMLDLKKQISMISFTHEDEIQKSEEDPEAFWSDVVMDAFEIDAENNPLLEDIEKLSRLQSKSLSR
jgi:hypothetical protein